MRSRRVCMICLAALLMGLVALSVAQESRSRPEVHMVQDIRYVSGGVGQGERDRLRQMAGEYNLKLVFAAQRGNYLSEIPVVIKDRQGNLVLETVTEGPWLYVDVPPGTYTVTATAYEQTRQQFARVSESGQSELRFYWHAAPFEDRLITRETAARQ